MSNTSTANWFARTRRAWIEHRAAEAGSINLREIQSAFDVSYSQASADVQAVLADRPECLVYDKSAKTYLWHGGSPCQPPRPIAAFAGRGAVSP